MRKRYVLLTTVLAFILLVVGCAEAISVKTDLTEVTLTAGETFMLDIESNDAKGLSFESMDESVLTISDLGVITAVGEGQTKVKVSAKSDSAKIIFIDVTVYKAVSIEAANSYSLMVGETLSGFVTANDTLSFESSDEAIFEVDESGVVTAKSVGTATLKVLSEANPTVSKDIAISVTKYVNIDITDYEVHLLIDETKTIEFTATEAVYLESSDTSVVTVNDLGVVVAKGLGEATVKIITNDDHSIFEEVTIYVFDYPTSITLDANPQLNVGNHMSINVSVFPEQAYPAVTYTSSDETIASFNEANELVAHKTGSVTVTVTSVADDQVLATSTVEVIHQILVDGTVSSGTKEYEGLTYTYGVDLFSNITDALEASTDGATIFVNSGTYDEAITIMNKVQLIGNNATLTKAINIGVSDVSIAGFTFEGLAQITNSTLVSNVTIQGNTFSELNQDAINLTGISTVSITDNTFNQVTGIAISLDDIRTGLFLVKHNQITDVTTGIDIKSDTAVDGTKVEVIWNTIDQVVTGAAFDLSTSHVNTKAIFRFNKVTNYTTAASQAQSDHVDFTLNYWGGDIDTAKFVNLNTYQLRGFYTNELAVVSEANYNPQVPVSIEILNPIDEIIIGETHTFQYEILPLDMETTKIRWITSAPIVLTISNGVITPLRSGNVTISLRSTVDVSVLGSVTFVVTTTPGIELSLTEPMNDVIVGDTLKLDATPFPFDYANKPLTYSSSDTAIATIDQSGNITTLGAGLVTFRVEFVEDAEIYQEFKLQVYNTLDENNLLDLLTKSMVTYSTPHEWTVYGVGFNYTDFKYESVSRYLFDDLYINQSKMLPISTGIRPGILKPAHPAGITTYNPDNVYWIVVHETANTAPGGGALSHANYLWNAATNGTVLNTSWHFTMDDKELYQHVPLNEIAYHAGDGSTLPGTSSTYFGGGNRNGIGIETSVALDGDNYRVWQRTAKLAAELMVEYNLPFTQLAYHQDFSGKICPQSLIRGNLIGLFEELADYEYRIEKFHGDAQMSLESHDPEYVDNTGRVVKMPDRAMTVSYTVTVTENNVTSSRTFYTYLPGTVH